MEIYTGGRSQGKLGYVLAKKGYGMDVVLEASLLNTPADLAGYKVINHFHEFTKKYADQPDIINNMAEIFIKEIKEIIIISDQVGGGIVPLDMAERKWRELHGRTMCRLAGNASHVERVIFGIGQVIK